NNAEAFKKQIKEKQDAIRKDFRQQKNIARKALKSISLKEARDKSLDINFKKNQPPKPAFLGVKLIDDYRIEDIRPYIDWKMFFAAWGIKGKYPDILKLKNNKGVQARKLHDEAKVLLDEMVRNQRVVPRAIIGIFPAASRSDDILIFENDKRKQVRTILHMLRQQNGSAEKDKYISLSDYIAPENSGSKDYIGMFAASVGFGADEIIENFKAQNDAYNSVMFRLLCDRLTEAFSDILHHKIEYELWGYNHDKSSGNHQILKKGFTGIRPAPGYPTCPDHSLKADIFRLLDVQKSIGIELTETYAMKPASSVCGCYFAHPESKYFTLGKISRDQIEDYAKRKKINPELAETLFKPYLDYKTY
ncbi:MAG: vitamin B12 dependent-methionine synthase activation domain-containing protein, partial [Bacteroidales bacterium]